MRKRFKKILASVLVAVMILTAAPLSGFVGLNFDWLDFSTKSSALESSGSCGENVTYTFDSSIGLLTISGTGLMYDYDWGSSPFYSNSSIKTVVIENGVTSIGKCAFEACSGISNVAIPGSVTNIGEDAFWFCSSLTSIEIPDSVTNISDEAFKICTSLTSIEIPNSVTRIGSAVFSSCTGLTSIEIPNSVTSIGEGAFRFCSGLTSITIPDSVKSIGDSAFWACTGLTSVTIGNSVTSIGNVAFSECANLTRITIPDSVTSIGSSAFYGCIGLTSVTIPDSVTSIGSSAFYGCIGLTSVTIPDSVTSIGYRAFYGCTGLASVTIPDSVTSIGDSAFYGVLNVSYSENTKATGSPWGATYDNKYVEEKIVYNDSTKTTIIVCHENISENVIIPNEVISISNSAFSSRTGLKSITIPQSVTEIGARAFSSCSNLKNVIFESDEYIEMDSSVFLDSPNVIICCKENSYMHYYADMEGLKYCILDDNNDPGFTIKNDVLVSYSVNTENVFLSSASKIGFEAFKGNTSVKTVELANNVTRIYSSAFKNCSNLEKVIIPKNVSSIGDTAFTGCSKLTIWCYAGSYAEVYAINHDIPVEYITLRLSDNTILVETSEIVNLTASFSTDLVGEDKIIWTSSDTSIATVENGVVTVVDAGAAEITATTASGLSASCDVVVDFKLDSAADASIDSDAGLVFGADIVNKDAAEIKELFANRNISVKTTDDMVGTGDKISLLKADGSVYKEIDVVIFGDVNGDGWYDGTDSIIVNCLANGLLSREQVGEAVYMAADCNHDGVIDNLDVALLEQAGMILASVDQSKSAEELQTDSAYQEYINLIDQTVETENVEENPTGETETTTETPVDEQLNQTLLQRIFAFIKYIFAMIVEIF